MKTAASLRLRDLEILVVDCQATTSRPETGFLLEIGWGKVRVSDTCNTQDIEAGTQAFLLSPPGCTEVPPQVLRITGIPLEALKSAHSKQSVWERLQEEAQNIADESDIWPCPAVIHFARYETPFLSRLHAEFGNGTAFPLDIVCTHQIVQRLFPGLPRKGLRAVTGFFGYALPELRRCRHHVLATALIWRHLVEKLESEQDITSLPELQAWLAHPISLSPHQKSGRVYPMDKKLRQGLPVGPGLYRMYRLSGDILYLGKAKSLKQRVNSYFRAQSRHSEHILEMLSQAKDLTYTQTQSALEAAVKESDEIKRLRPPFNRALQDNGRELCYFSLDLKMFKAGRLPARFPLGPFTSARHALPLGFLMDLLNGDFRRVSGRIIREIMDLPLEHLPERLVFKQGLRDLQQEYPDLASGSVNIATLKRLGAQLWRDRLIEALRDSEDPELESDTDETEKSEPDIWTRKRVARVIKSLIRRSTHQIRRAGWLLRLSESRLIWSAGWDADKKHMAEVHEARVTFPELSEGGLDSPFYPGSGSDLESRHAFFDIAAYDRMRVLTTEIRRLVQEGRDVELHLTSHTRLSTARLRRLLPWV